MKQYYVGQNGQQLGPYDEGTLKKMIQENRVSPDDLLWTESWEQWRKVRDQFPPGSPPPMPTVMRSGSREPAAASQDGQMFYAGFWWRFLASFLDGIIVAVLTLPVQFAAGAGPGSESEGSAGLLINIVIAWLYFAIQESSEKRATFGKRALGLYVTDLEGNRLSFGHATGRHVSKVLSYLTLFIGFMMAGWTERKQALHDMAAGCLVMRNSDNRLSAGAIVAIVLLATIPVIGILAAISIPAYQDYRTRAIVAAALVQLDANRGVAVDHLRENAALPLELQIAPGVAGANSNLSKIALARGAGTTVEMTGTFKSEAPGPIAGKTVSLVSDDGGETWRCAGNDLPQRVLPQSCRK